MLSIAQNDLARKRTAPSLEGSSRAPISPPHNPLWDAVATSSRAGGPPRVQAKLAISQPGGPYEQEADRVADQVMRMPEPAVQRKCPACGAGSGPCPKCDAEQGSLLHRKADAAASSSAFSDATGLISHLGPGQPLDHGTRAFFEPRFGQDFSHVRLHTDEVAHQSARDVNASAYTIGSHIVFNGARFAPNAPNGQQLLAHELTHVVQQGGASTFIQRYSTEDCDSEDVTRIHESHNRAIDLVKAAIARLTADPVTAETQAHFANHFGGYGSWRRDIVVRQFRRDLALLTDSKMTYECESECDEGEPAYTYWVFGDIHVCLPWLRSQVLTERGETFVHEMHHWDALRGHLDLGYHTNNQDNHTTWAVAVNNADAYSELAQDLYEQP